MNGWKSDYKGAFTTEVAPHDKSLVRTHSAARLEPREAAAYLREGLQSAVLVPVDHSAVPQ